MQKKILKFEPDDFNLELSTVWSFPQHGSWATHDAKYRGNWSPYIPRNVLLRYSNEGDLVLDQFVGGGTTLVEAKLLNRNCIGVDINPYSIEICKKKCNFSYNSLSMLDIKVGDARKLNFIRDSSIDLICTHPPYANIIHYSKNIENDLSNLSISDFLLEIKNVAQESYRVLKKNKFCAILIGDTRKNGCIIPLAFEVMKIFQKEKFIIKELIIKKQHNCKMTGYWKKNSIKYNFLLINHEFLFIFKK